MAYTNVANMFEVIGEVSQLLIPINCKLEMVKLEFNPGDTIIGKVVLTHRTPFYTKGILVVIDGRVQVRVPTKNHHVKDSVTNLHIFTNVADNNSGKKKIFLRSGTQIYPFAIQLPLTNSPGSYLNRLGQIFYTVSVVLDMGSSRVNLGSLNTSYLYKTIAEECITINSYFNLNSLNSITQLATQSWQTQDKWIPGNSNLKISKNSIGGESLKISNSDGKKWLSSSSQIVSFEFSLNQVSFVPGDRIAFNLKIKNPARQKLDKISVAIVHKVVFTVWGSEIISNKLASIGMTSTSSDEAKISWEDKIQIPITTFSFSEGEGTKMSMPSSTTTQNQPIIFQYFIVVEILREGKESLSAEALICIGTTRQPVLTKPKILTLDIRKCTYPVGCSNVAFPEDWNEMHKTGRIGHCKNKTGELRMEKLIFMSGPNAQDDSDCRSLLSYVSMSSTKTESSLGSTSGYPPPRYSALSSRRQSLTSLPPPYEEVTHLRPISGSRCSSFSSVQPADQ